MRVVDRTLAQLAGTSLLTFTLDGSTVRAHRLVLRVILCSNAGPLIGGGVVTRGLECFAYVSPRGGEIMGRLRQHAPLVARAAPVSSPHTRYRDQVEAEGDGAGGAGVIWPAWVQRCGIGSSCECPPQDQLAGVQRDLQAATAGGGTALPAATRAAMEHAFSADFSAVRVHTGPASDRVASGLGARALTAGQDILFGPGGFRPHTPAGDRLLAHELAHVVQQAGGLPRAALDSGAADPLEKAAEAAADRAAQTGVRLAYELTHVVQQRGGATPQRQAEVALHHDVAESQADAVAADVTREIGEARIVQGAPTRAGQLSREAFMRELKQLITDAAAEELGPFWSVTGCPYIEAFFERHRTTDASRIEQLAKRYSGVENASLAADYYAPILVRVRNGVRHWRNGEDISGDLSAAGMSAMAPIIAHAPQQRDAEKAAESTSGSEASDPVADAAATDPVAQVHRRPGARAATGRDPAAVRVQLGKGVQLPAATRQQMEQGFGRGLGHIRLHTDETAARLAASAGVMAFTVGDDVAFSAGRYRPGTLEGDLLLAHELAHTIQQGTGAGAAGAREPASFDEAPLEDVADLAAAHAVASLRGVRIPGLPAPKLAPGRAGLRLQGCKERTHLDPVAVGPIPAYDKFTTPDGKIIDTEESAAALLSMVQNPDQLDQLWSDAQSGNARAKAVINRLDPEWVNVGRATAEREGRVRCLTPPGQVVTQLLDDESCLTDWSALDFFRADRPGGAHVRERIALGYSQRARELHIRNNIIIASLNLFMAGWTVKSALAGEARALGVEPPADVPQPPPKPQPAPQPEPPSTTPAPPKPPPKDLEPPRADEPTSPAPRQSRPPKTPAVADDPQAPVREALDRVKQKIADADAEIAAHQPEVREAAAQVQRLYQKRSTARKTDPGTEELQGELTRAQKRMNELAARQKHRGSINDQNRAVRDRLQNALNAKTYDRPPKWTKAERATVWRNAQDENGKVFGPSKKEIKPGEPWIMGHKPRFEFWKHALSAARRAITRDQFLRECEDLSMYRPETPEESSNRIGEDRTDAYDGP